MMGKDEKKAFELLEKNRTLQKPIVEECYGRWIKELGDGVLTSFNSVSDAVTAAIRIQSECRKAKEFQLRIGIHLGEVVFENNDVFGNGVNIAARLQSIAPPGGIYISESVERNIKNQKDLHVIYVRKGKFKNIQEPERIYQIVQEEILPHSSPIDGRQHTGSYKSRIMTISVIALLMSLGYLLYQGPMSGFIHGWSDISKSIAVLPFKVIGSDEEGKYFAEGVADVLINHLHGIENLNVRSRTSMEKYDGSSKTIPEIAQELDVQYVLEGSVQKYKDDVRIIVQLINPRSDDHLWSKEYNEKYEDIFRIQSEIALNIASELNIKLAGAQKRRIERIPTTSTEAWDLYLRGKEHHRAWWKFRELTDINFAIGFYKQAIQKDASFALAYTWLANAIWDKRDTDAEGRTMSADSLLYFIQKSIQINPVLPDNFAALAKYHAYELQDYSVALEYIDKAIRLDSANQTFLTIRGRIYTVQGKHPDGLSVYMHALQKEPSESYPVLLISIAQSYICVGEFDLAMSFIQKALELSPDDLRFLHLLAHLQLITGQYEEFMNTTNKSLSIRKDNIGLIDRGRAYLLLGNYHNAEISYADFYALPKEKTTQYGYEKSTYAFVLRKLGKQQEAMQMINETKQWIEENNFNSAYELAKVYTFLGQPDAALRHLHAWKPDMGIHAWIDKDPLFESLRDLPEFKTLVREFQAEIEGIQQGIRAKIQAGELPTLAMIE